jgi:DNA-3-methyladenine glycosylase I
MPLRRTGDEWNDVRLPQRVAPAACYRTALPMATRERCRWAGTDPQMIEYHDREWGVPVHDDRHLFEMLTLEGAQAGLSWSTILRKRAAYRVAFAEFDPARVARFGPRDVERLMNDAGIVRNRLKIESTIANAQATLDLQAEAGSLDQFVWSFVDGRPIPRGDGPVPAKTPESDALSRALRKRGFRFVGSTICYAFMQACGLVDDHVPPCFRAGAAPRARPRRRLSSQPG